MKVHQVRDESSSGQRRKFIRSEMKVVHQVRYASSSSGQSWKFITSEL